MNNYTLHHGNCLTILPTIEDASIDAIVTDPPYELGFMGKAWDGSGVAYDVDLWRQCLRALKPGGHLLAFGGTRTYHRLAVAIEDAGFEIRDSIHWLYGSGFPKSLDVSKAIDKQRHDRADVYRVTAWIREARDAAGVSNRDIDNAFGFAGMAGHWTSAKSQPAVPTLEQVPTLLDVLGVALDDVPDDIRRLLWELNGRKGQPGENWAKREVVGERSVPVGHAFAGPVYGGDSSAKVIGVTAPATDAARAWEGWGTALKPAHEPIVVARKPLSGTVAATVLEHGTGALNIDGCRVWTTDKLSVAGGERVVDNTVFGVSLGISSGRSAELGGRWPANLVLTHASDCVDECAPGCPVARLDEQQDGASRFFTVTEWSELDVPFLYVAKPGKKERNAGLDGLGKHDAPGVDAGRVNGTLDGKPTAPRQNFHPTVKPVALMRWLVRLVTPPGGTILDPFAGSGTTLIAAIHENLHPIGIELTDEYIPIIHHRCQHAINTAPHPTLFQ